MHMVVVFFGIGGTETLKMYRCMVLFHLFYCLLYGAFEFDLHQIQLSMGIFLNGLASVIQLLNDQLAYCDQFYFCVNFQKIKQTLKTV